MNLQHVLDYAIRDKECKPYKEGYEFDYWTYKDGKITLPGDYYIIVKTIMGKTTFIKWGPLEPDFEALPNTFKLEVKTAPYKEATIAKEIQSFINDGLKGIHDAFEVLPEEAAEFLPQEINYNATLE